MEIRQSCFKVEVSGHITVYVIARSMTEACWKVETSKDKELEKLHEWRFPEQFPVIVTSCERLGGYAITE